MIKIIFSDMDGTLLTSKNELPDGFDEMIAELKSRGVIFAPSSGRQYFSLRKTFAKYENDFLFLGDNGTLVVYKGEEVISSPLGFAVAKKILEVTEPLKENILRVYSGKKNAYILREQDIPEYQFETNKYYDQNVAVDDWSEIEDTPIKISFFDKTGDAAKNIYPHVAQFEKDLQVVLASSQWVDITSQGVSKGSAVKSIQRLWNIKPEECAAFGDFMNDYEMLQSVKYSFAMANAYPEVKKVAKFETLSNEDFGVIAGIKKLIDDGLI